MPIKKFVKDYLTFSKTDRRGVIALVILVLTIYLLPVVFPARQTQLLSAKLAREVSEAIDTIEERKRGVRESYFKYSNNSRETALPGKGRSADLFRFDPNIANEGDFIRLGLSPRTAATIIKFRSKGGKFFKADDFKKIWGLPPGFYERVESYIDIPSKAEAAPRSFEALKPRFTQPLKLIELVDVNSADSSAFEALPGIGAKLSQRIIQFRDKLGGFYSADQIAEVYGLSDSIFQKIKPFFQVSGIVKLISINTVTKDGLKLHPYFRWKLANAIVEYRNQHGPFKTLEELKNISAIDADNHNKIVHYLSL